ncbi:MAG: RNA methyltransferase PUA domain-containing protein, partial [Candidatus Electrothrix sp.]
MNLLLFEQHEQNAGRLLLTDQRAKHIHTVLKLKLGDTLRIGMVHGKMGRGQIISMDNNAVELEVQLDCAPPTPPDVELILA